MTEKEKLLIPQYRFGSVLDITPDDLKNMGAKAVGLDIDNTIAPDGKMDLLPGINCWIKTITGAGFPVIIISNGTVFRVGRIAKLVGGVPFVHLAGKPSPRGLLKAAKMAGVDISELAMCGDQLFSDIKAANRCGAIAVRTDPVPMKSLYPRYYKWKDRREKPYLDYFESLKSGSVQK